MKHFLEGRLSYSHALWRTKNEDEWNQIAKEMAGEVGAEKCVEVYDYS